MSNKSSEKSIQEHASVLIRRGMAASAAIRIAREYQASVNNLASSMLIELTGVRRA